MALALLEEVLQMPYAPWAALASRFELNICGTTRRLGSAIGYLAQDDPEDPDSPK